MAVLVTLLAIVLALLALLVAGLLRSHAEILRELHGLGVDMDPARDDHDLASVTTAATPNAGTELLKLVIPPTSARYLGFNYTPLTSNTTQGNVNAYFVKNTQNALY